MTERWSPLLENLPELSGPLLSCLRTVLPALFDAALRAPEATTMPVTANLGLDDDPSARLSVAGHDLWRGEHGARDALFLRFTGRAEIRQRSLPVAGDAVVDLATSALLRLHLTQPMVL